MFLELSDGNFLNLSQVAFVQVGRGFDQAGATLPPLERYALRFFDPDCRHGWIYAGYVHVWVVGLSGRNGVTPYRMDFSGEEAKVLAAWMDQHKGYQK